MVVPAPDKAVVYHISVLLLEAFATETALVHVAPVCEMELILFAVVVRPEITAIKVLPFVGADPNVTANEVTVFVPVFPVAL